MNWQSAILLGTGGNHPCLEVFNTVSNETIKYLDFPQGHSAYSIDIQPEQGTIGIGTKGGLIYIIDKNWEDTLDEPASYKRLVQGASILSICWLEKFFLAASDIAGRILLWHTDQKSNAPEILQTLEENICSLKCSADGRLISLSSKGVLQFWNPQNHELTHTVYTSTPPAISALVQIVFWPDNRTIACPGAEGELTLVNPDTGDIRMLYPHDGTFYALSTYNGNLLTVGINDGRLKIWRPDSEKPDLDLRIQKNVVGARVTENSPAKLILIESNGKAGIYSLVDGNVRLIKYCKNQDYRMISQPLSGKMQNFYALQSSKEVKMIISEIKSKIGRVTNDVIDELHRRLINLGYEHVSLALRADEAEKKGNTAGAIRLCREFINLLPNNDPKICPSMEKYARLLERVWHISEADHFCKQIYQIDFNYPFTIQPENISKTADILKNEHWIIEPEFDVSIDIIIDSATIIGKKFFGRYVLSKLKPIHFNRVRIDLIEILEKYERIRKTSINRDLPAASQETIQWVARGRTEQIKTIIFDNDVTIGVKGLQFAAQVLNGDLNTTVIIPVVLFDWRNINPDTSFEDENNNAINTLNNLLNQKNLSNSYLATIHNVLTKTLQRLFTEKIPREEYP